MRYTVLLDFDPEFGAYTVTVPALPGCITQGATVEESLERAREAIEGFVASLVKDGEEVPVEEPSLIPLVVEVDIAAESAALAATG
ncbi:MAG: type II toxin-antitoxin system HicB family antitoxin [Chloroflexia bacterium]|nr:type II toxin-antitoxin system HicB family antitoxin [Chloroflexia bacterium]